VNVIARARVAAEEACEICAVRIAAEHQHVVDVRDRRLLCACRPCYLLFVHAGAAQGRYRAVGDRTVTLDGAAFDGPAWDALGIPVGLAFFFLNSATERVAAFYPAPGGATESQLPMNAWESLAAYEPRLSRMQPDVEAALVYRRRGETTQAYLVPIDVCYELVGTVRTCWQGFDGGQELRDRVDALFARVREQCA
jgi:azurin